MSVIVERVNKLIALATDKGSGENESRNAALQAAKLIAEHQLLASGPATSQIASFLKGLPLERIMRDAGTIALGASTVEILQLKGEVNRLKAENERLRSKLRRRRR